VPERLFLELVAYGIRSAGITVTLNLGENLRTFGAGPRPVRAGRHEPSAERAAGAQEDAAAATTIFRTRHKPAQSQVRLMITHNGPGIPPKLRSRVFEPVFTTKP
jgi:nitrogen fixation/metabolism regulation signal transduction histidine kinase